MRQSAPRLLLSTCEYYKRILVVHVKEDKMVVTNPVCTNFSVIFAYTMDAPFGMRNDKLNGNTAGSGDPTIGECCNWIETEIKRLVGNPN